MIASNPPNAIATAKGHLDLNRRGQRSTKPARDSDAGSQNYINTGVDEFEIDEQDSGLVVKVLEMTNINHIATSLGDSLFSR